MPREALPRLEALVRVRSGRREEDVEELRRPGADGLVLEDAPATSA